MSSTSSIDPDAQRAPSPPHADGQDASLADRAYRQIEDLIVRLEFRPGQPMSEAEIGARLGMGRTPVREALHRLAREGLILISPRRGVFVTEMRVDAQLRLLEVRRSLERLMCARAARLASPEQRTVFGQIAKEMREAGKIGDDLAFIRLDQQLNEQMAATSANEFAASAIALTAGLSRRFWFRYYRTMADLPLTCTLHADVAAAIAAGKPDDASTASDRLLDYIERFTRSVFESLS